MLQRKGTSSIRRFLYLVSLLVLGTLIVVNGYYMSKRLFQSKTEVYVYKQELVELGKEVALGFKIVNSDIRAQNYTYNVNLNISREYAWRNFTEGVLVPGRRSYECVIKFSPKEIGVIKVNITIYKGDEKNLVEEVTYFIKVTGIE